MKNKKLVMGITVFIVCTLGLTGFGKMVDSAVVEEKTAVENENGENAIGAETGGAAEDIRNLVSVPEQVQAPEKYQGVPVEVPDVDAITIKKVVPQEDNEKWIPMIEKISDEGTLKTEEVKYTSDAHAEGKMEINSIPYSIYSSAGYPSEEDLTSMSRVSVIRDLMWMSIQNGKMINSMTDEPMEFKDSTDLDKSKDSAERLVESLEIRDFYPAVVQEKPIVMNYMDSESQEKQTATIQNVRVIFERIVDGIPLTCVDPILYPYYWEVEDGNNGVENNWETQRWDMETLCVMTADEMLWSFSYMEPMEISNYSDEKLFLLPFDEISRIYEFVVTDKYKPADEVKLSKVKLGYMRIREDKMKREGLLVPVWDFFGTTKDIQDDLYSVLTIDARDGSIIKRKQGL